MPRSSLSTDTRPFGAFPSAGQRGLLTAAARRKFHKRQPPTAVSELPTASSRPVTIKACPPTSFMGCRPHPSWLVAGSVPATASPRTFTTCGHCHRNLIVNCANGCLQITADANSQHALLHKSPWTSSDSTSTSRSRVSPLFGGTTTCIKTGGIFSAAPFRCRTYRW